MSLEQAIEANTAALRDLIAALSAGTPTTAAQVAAVATEAKAETKPAAAKSEKAKAEQKAPEQPAAEGVSYEQVKHAITQLANKKGRDEVVKVLGEFKVAKGPDLKPEQYADFVKAANDAAATVAA